MTKVLLLSLGAIVSCHSQPRAPAATGDPATLSISSRTPLINVQAELIAGYWETSKDVNFTALRFTNYPQENAFVPIGDTSAASALEQSVNAYLSHGRWRAMIPGVRVRRADGATWRFGNTTITENTEGTLMYFDASGKHVADSPFRYRPRLPYEEDCRGKAFEVELTDLAYDPATLWTWATYRLKGDAPDCHWMIYAAVFHADTGVKYPYQLAKPK